MKVQDLMEKDVTTTTIDERLSDAIATLADAGVHGLPVIDPRTRKTLGVISTTDILETISEHDDGAAQRFLETTNVGEIMTPNPTTISPNANVTEAAQTMLYREVHRLFVEDGDRLVGVISQSDIVRAVGTAKI